MTNIISLRRIMKYRPERLLVVLIGMATMVAFVGPWQLASLPHQAEPVEIVRHPGYDSSKIYVVPRKQVTTTKTTTTTTTKTINKSSSSSSSSNSFTTVCDGYDGVLHIQSGDSGAAAGTVFFMYVVNQLIYADMYNLLPWIHLNNVSKHVYDPIVHSGHGKNTNAVLEFEMLHGMTIPFTSDGYRRFGFGSYAGPPELILKNSTLNRHVYQVTGTGIWNHYFQPIPNDQNFLALNQTDCQNKPLLRMHYYHLNPGMLYFCPWSVKSWPYAELLPRLSPNKPTSMTKTSTQKLSLKEWYLPMRKRGQEIVQKYIKFRPYIHQKVEMLFMTHSNSTTSTSTKACLAMHIRHSDKGGTNRKKIPLTSFLPYAQAYIDAGGSTIYLATDSSEVIHQIFTTWPNEIQTAMIRQSDDILRSSNRKAVFELNETSHDRTNTEVLVDILAMSKCSFFIHGFSAVSEAVMYLNLELLQSENYYTHSVDLENHPWNNVEHRLTPDQFQDIVQKKLAF